MKLDEFKDCVDIYSADLSRWPQDRLKAALLLMEESPEAKSCFERDLRLLEAAQGLAPAMPDLFALENRIVQRVRDLGASSLPEAAAVFRWKLPWLAAPGGGLLAAAFLGFMIGLHPPQGELLLDPVFYAEDQIIRGDSDFYDGGVF